MNLHPVHQCNDGLFNSFTGRIIDINNPSPDMICIVDISSALSKICRFGGHCGGFYSVAQHSIIVAFMAPPEYRMEALLHDAAEAYLGDVIKPLKVILGESYGIIEEKFTEAIVIAFGLDIQKLKAVKEWDRMALEVEHEYLQKGNSDVWNSAMSAIDMSPDIWHHTKARQMFLSFFYSFQLQRDGVLQADICDE